MTRRELLWLASIGMAGIPAVANAVTTARPPDPLGLIGTDPIGLLGTTSDPETLTIEAVADTLIPGEKRFPSDVAIAGVARGAGAVQAGALEFMRFHGTGIGAAVPAFAVAVNAEAVAYAAEHGKIPDLTLPPFVGLHYNDRKAMLDGLLNSGGGDETLLWFALAGLVFLSYHTAGYLSTADAVRQGHPGLKAIGFPMPDRDGLWRFPHFSYRRKLARIHPHTTTAGQPR
ncbi:MAG TPA: DUF5987 family protein [Mycobacteriales bacterium]|jgi:hypothetical protein|nr:DUF5987 family protein [Mycobacteriales bacterium]